MPKTEKQHTIVHRLGQEAMNLRSIRELTQTIREKGNIHQPSTLVEVLGTRRILVEHHHGIVGYGSEEIQVAASYGILRVSGADLRLCCMNREQVFISGQIYGITMEHGGA